jgi:predicted nuclease of predicted toxin-antitoxin system
LDVVKNLRGLLITEDKDFGELVFSHGIEGVSVILMRYDQPQYVLIEADVLKCLEDYFSDPVTCFITITKNKIRRRRI